MRALGVVLVFHAHFTFQKKNYFSTHNFSLFIWTKILTENLLVNVVKFFKKFL